MIGREIWSRAHSVLFLGLAERRGIVLLFPIPEHGDEPGFLFKIQVSSGVRLTGRKHRIFRDYVKRLLARSRAAAPLGRNIIRISAKNIDYLGRFDTHEPFDGSRTRAKLLRLFTDPES